MTYENQILSFSLWGIKENKNLNSTEPNTPSGQVGFFIVQKC